MSATTETGHAKNVANLGKFNQLIATFGSNFNPSNPAISATALQTLHANAGAQITAFNVAFANWKNATNNRELAFEPLGKMATQILGALQSLPLPTQTIDDFEVLVKKFRSRTKKSSKTKAADPTSGQDEQVAALPTDPAEPKSISTSQQSFDNKLQHFEKMVLILQNIPSYAPNETAFQVATLQAQQAALHALNDAANTSYTALRFARTNRNAFFYGNNTGLLDLLKNAKAYIKSIYGASSPQFRSANDLRFIKVIAK